MAKTVLQMHKEDEDKKNFYLVAYDQSLNHLNEDDFRKYLIKAIERNHTKYNFKVIDSPSKSVITFYFKKDDKNPSPKVSKTKSFILEFLKGNYPYKKDFDDHFTFTVCRIGHQWTNDNMPNKRPLHLGVYDKDRMDNFQSVLSATRQELVNDLKNKTFSII